jgi:hypothetical protein
MNRFVIADGLPYLLAHGKTYAVRWDHKGFTVGMEVKLASIPTITHGELGIHAKCAACLDSITVHAKDNEQQEEEDLEQENHEPEQPEQEPEDQKEPDILDGMTVAQLKEFAADNGIDLGDAKKKADILAVIKNAGSQDVMDNDSDG